MGCLGESESDADMVVIAEAIIERRSGEFEPASSCDSYQTRCGSWSRQRQGKGNWRQRLVRSPSRPKSSI